MGTREDRVFEAAIRVFSRYGVKRATMNDIASEAGIVRQTLYNMCTNKDEVLRATIRWFTDRSLAAIETECAKVTALGERLDIVFEHLAVKPFELLSASPHAEDVVSGFNDAARREISVAGERKRAVIERVLAPYQKKIRAAGLELVQLSDFIQRSVAALKHDARNKKHLRELLGSLKVLVLKAAGQA